MVFTPFTELEVRQIFVMSEMSGGHAGARHVNMSKEQLWQRVQAYQGSKLALRTSFLTFADQLKAAFDVLNDPQNAAALERFRVEAKASDPRHFEMIDLARPSPVRMHYGMGGGAHVFPCSLVSLILHKRSGPPRDMHVVTFFGTMGPMV